MTPASIDIRPFEHPASGLVRTSTLYQPAEAAGSPRCVVVVVHGLFVDRTMPEIVRFCRGLAHAYDVVSVDMRGHGDAPGAFTWGREEHRDLADLVAFLRALYAGVGVVGFSFGGDVAIFSAALSKARLDGAIPDAICTVGAPAHLDLWRYRLRLEGSLRHVRMALRRRHRRFVPGWPHLRWRRAVDVVGGVSPVPLMILHGTSDWLVHPDQAAALFAAAGPPKELVMIEGALHAEFIIAQNPDLLLDPIQRFFGTWLSALSARSADPGGALPGDVSLRRDRS
jgi:pimeloyl-ACP methyl ester carboxylesterase